MHSVYTKKVGSQKNWLPFTLDTCPLFGKYRHPKVKLLFRSLYITESKFLRNFGATQPTETFGMLRISSL